MILQNVCFRTPEQFMIKALIFINGFPLKKGVTTNMIFSGVPEGRVLKAYYTALLILTMALHGWCY
tara:strand:+ start:12634 stop:12831 length:198 start_codon:yes stop_codon:yes gene_type:complete